MLLRSSMWRIPSPGVTGISSMKRTDSLTGIILLMEQIDFWPSVKESISFSYKNMTFCDSNTSSSFRWPKSFFHGLANACVRYANKWLHLCPFVCLYTLFILSYCRVALETNECLHSIILKIRRLLHHFIIFSQTLNKSIVLFHLENAEFCILIQAWTIFLFCFHYNTMRKGHEKYKVMKRMCTW